MKYIHMKITAYILIFVIAVSGVSSALTLTASAVTQTADLYGTGSADDIDITKILDMALNKGGLSMSPATIRQFIEFWWDSVVSDLNTCMSNADSAFTATQDYADYIISALDGSAKFEKLVPVTVSYIRYVLTLNHKSLSDFKQLLLQPDTFRKFLLSYILDEDGNIADTVNNKLKKYNLKTGFISMVRKAADAYIEENEGYYLIRTMTHKDLSPGTFESKEVYNAVVASLKTIKGDDVWGYSVYYMNHKDVFLWDFKGCNFVMYSPKSGNRYMCYLYDDNWTKLNVYAQSITAANPVSIDLSAHDQFTPAAGNGQLWYDGSSYCDSNNYSKLLFSADGHIVRFWKSLDAFKAYSVGKSNIYYSNGYSDFDESGDSGLEFTGSYYSNQTYSHTTIQNNIDNSQEINETTVNNIINNYITNNYYGTDDSGGGGSGGGESGGGNWLTELINGIPELLTALIDGLSGIVDSIAGLLEKLVGAVSGLFIPSEDSINALKDKAEIKFSFISDFHKEILDIVDRFETMGETAPTITFPLSKTPLAGYGVGDVTVSFDWFEPYRYGFHSLLSAIMWIMFLFNQYFAIKNLVQGTSSFAGSLSEPEPEHNSAGFNLW